jgi:membrane protein involved in colicin uptake
MEQALYLVNSDEFQAKVVNSPRMRRILEQNKSDAETIEELYLATLARAPTEKEKQRVLDYVLGESKTAAAQANAGKKAAEEALAKVKEELVKTVAVHEAAERAAKEAEAKATLKDKPAEEQKKAAIEATALRQVANQAKTKRDQLAGEEKAAVARLAEANRKIDAVNAAHQQQRVPALQDVLWTLLNTKEFMCNH